VLQLELTSCGRAWWRSVMLDASVVEGNELAARRSQTSTGDR